MILDYKTAKTNFLSAKIQGCRKFFEFHRDKLEQAYCEIIFDNLKGARKIFEGLEDKDIRAHWGLVMLDFIKGTVSRYPTYFELRNFLEIDINLLIMYCKGDYVEKIVRYADFMFTINPEVYKFIGRVFLNNGMKIQAMFFLKRAKERHINQQFNLPTFDSEYYSDSNSSPEKNITQNPPWIPKNSNFNKEQSLSFSFSQDYSDSNEKKKTDIKEIQKKFKQQISQNLKQSKTKKQSFNDELSDDISFDFDDDWFNIEED